MEQEIWLARNRDGKFHLFIDKMPPKTKVIGLNKDSFPRSTIVGQ